MDGVMKMPAKAIDVAKYLVKLANDEVEPDLLTNLHVQKLLYYVQSWHLANNDAPLFQESIEGWKYGPVVRSVFESLAKYERNPVIFPDEPIVLNEVQQKEIKRVWDYYKKYSASELVNMTHYDDPWLESREGNPEANTGPVITNDRLRDYFKQKADRELRQFGLTKQQFEVDIANWKANKLTTFTLKDAKAMCSK